MKLYLKRYKRLMVSNVQSFEWTPSKNLMILIGKNGSGKSSILEQLTPLPAPKDQFHKGGEKIFQCLHKESIYNLHSVYDGKGTGHHSFIKDGVELNEGKTYSIQEELCKHEFGVTRELEGIIKGTTKFSSMPVDKRKKLLTQMFPLDLSYAFDVFGKASKSLRDKAGQIREVNARLISDNLKLPDDATMYQLNQETDRLVARLNRLFQESNRNTTQQFRNDTEAKAALDSLIQRAHGLLRQYPRLKGSVSVSNVDEFKRQVNVHVNEYQGVQAVVDRLVEELETLQRSAADQGGQITPAELEALKREHNELLKSGEAHMARCTAYQGQFPIIQFNTVGNPQATLDDLFNRWYAVANAIPENADGWMNQKDAQDNKLRLAELRVKKRTLDGMYDSISKHIASLKGCEHVVCPSCNHSFKPGIRPDEQQELEDKKARMLLAMEKMDAEVKRLEEYMEAFQDYSGHVFQFVQITKDYPQFQLLWDFCGGQMVMFREPRKWVREMLDWNDAMGAYVQGQLDLERASVLERRLAVIAEIDQDAVGYLRERSHKLEEEINAKLLWINARRIETQEYEDSGLGIVRFQEAVAKLVDEYDALQAKFRQQAEWLLNQAYEVEIEATQVQLAHSKQNLMRLQDQERTVRLMETMVSEASDAHRDINLLVKALSPTGGLIGTYMMGFMQGVCSLVNAVFDSLWSYPMEVLPSKIDNGTMDYKFPLSVNNGAVVTPDIEFGSHSQVSIADFAFKLAALKYLGFDDWPLFLDEFGRDFDDKHRSNIVPFITSFIEQGTYRQIFYISHFESIHGAFNQAEFAVLDPTNCVVPTAYNKNVRLS